MADHKRALLNSLWSNLPPEIISNIGKRLDSGIELCRLHSVCKNWHSSRKPNHISLLSPFLPLIISNASLPFTDRRHVPVILVARAVFLVKPLCSASASCGWLLTVEEVVPGKLQILYPLSTDRVEPLPSNCSKYLDLSKFIVSQVAKSYVFKYESDEEDVPDVIRVILCSGYTAMVLYGEGTLIGLSLKTGDWSYVSHSIISSFVDVISDGENHVRAIDPRGNVHVIDHCAAKVVKSIILPSVAFPGFDHINLLRSHGKFFSVACSQKNSSTSVKFDIYRLDETQSQWVYAANRRICSKVLFISSYWTFFLHTGELDMCNHSPKPEPKQSRRSMYCKQKEAMEGDYVIYSEKSFPCSLEYIDWCRLYEGASVDLRYNVFFFNSGDSSFWKKSLCRITIDVLWPPPTWFWPEPNLLSRDDEELGGMYGHNDKPHKIRELLPSASTVDASTGVATSNKRGVANSHAITVQKLNQISSTTVFEGIDIKSNFVPTLRKIWEKYGNVVEGSTIRNPDIMSRVLESLAITVIILQSNSGRSLSEDHVNYLSSALCDLQQMKFNVDWLVPSVEKAIAVYKSRPLVDSLKDFRKAKAQAEEMRLKVLDELTKLDEVEEDIVLVSERLPVLQSMEFDQSLGDGLGL